MKTTINKQKRKIRDRRVAAYASECAFVFHLAVLAESFACIYQFLERICCERNGISTVDCLSVPTYLPPPLSSPPPPSLPLSLCLTSSLSLPLSLSLFLSLFHQEAREKGRARERESSEGGEGERENECACRSARNVSCVLCVRSRACLSFESARGGDWQALRRKFACSMNRGLFSKAQTHARARKP